MTARSHTRIAKAKRARMRRRLSDHSTVRREKQEKREAPMRDSVDWVAYWGPTHSGDTQPHSQNRKD